MAVSKRLRFEIFRRDNHACRYCGQVSPEVILTVDHVVPVALGGSDDPSNLVTACKDCNAGKSSVPSGAHLVDDVAQDAIRWADAMKASFARALAQIEVRDAYILAFYQTWCAWRTTSDERVSMPSDWGASIAKWYALGLPVEILQDATNTSMRKRNLKGPDSEFRYMAGIVWGTLTEIQQQTASMMSAPTIGTSHDDTHCPWGCRVHPDDGGNDPEACPRCGQLGCPWFCGHVEGETVGWGIGWDHGYAEARQYFGYPIGVYNSLTNVTDGRVCDEFVAAQADGE